MLSLDNNMSSSDFLNEIKIEAPDSDDELMDIENSDQVEKDKNSIVFLPASVSTVNLSPPPLSYISSTSSTSNILPPPLVPISKPLPINIQNSTSQALKTYLIKRKNVSATPITLANANKQPPQLKTIILTSTQPIEPITVSSPNLQTHKIPIQSCDSVIPSSEIPPIVLKNGNIDRIETTTKIQNSSSSGNKIVDKNEVTSSSATSITSADGIQSDKQELPPTSFNGNEYSYFASYVANQLNLLPNHLAVELQMKIHDLITQAQLSIKEKK